MKKIILLSFFSLVSTSMVLYSCSDEDLNESSVIEKNSNGINNSITSFKSSKNNPFVSNKLSKGNNEEYTYLYDLKSEDKKVEEMFNGLLIEVSNDYKKAFVYNRNNLNGNYIEYNLVFDNERKGYRLEKYEEHSGSVQSKGGWGCAALCGIQGALIAATDGPSPVMDAIGIAYAVACASEC